MTERSTERKILVEKIQSNEAKTQCPPLLTVNLFQYDLPGSAVQGSGQ